MIFEEMSSLFYCLLSLGNICHHFVALWRKLWILFIFLLLLINVNSTFEMLVTYFYFRNFKEKHIDPNPFDGLFFNRNQCCPFHELKCELVTQLI